MVTHDLSWDYMKIKNDLRGTLTDVRLQKLGENENDERKKAKLKETRHLQYIITNILWEP